MRKLIILIILCSIVACSPIRRAQNKVEKLLTRYPELIDTKTTYRYDTVKFLEIYKKDSIILAMDKPKFDSLLFSFIELHNEFETYKEGLESDIKLPDLTNRFRNLESLWDSQINEYNRLLEELRQGAYRDTTIRQEDEYGYLELVFQDGSLAFSYKVNERHEIVPVQENTTIIDLKEKLTRGEILLIILILFVILHYILTKK